jgi:hypothetical protein
MKTYYTLLPKATELTFCGVSLFAFCAAGGLEDLGGPENACAAAATRPGLNAGAWSLLPAAVAESPGIGLLLAWFIPATSRRDVAAGFFVIARWAAAAMWPFLFPDPALLLLAWPIPAARRRDAAAGFAVIARWAAAVTAAPDA